jgi:hypothetical protein
MMSLAPPAANGTTSRTFRVGCQFTAAAGPEPTMDTMASDAATTITSRRLGCLGVSSWSKASFGCEAGAFVICMSSRCVSHAPQPRAAAGIQTGQPDEHGQLRSLSVPRRAHPPSAARPAATLSFSRRSSAGHRTEPQPIRPDHGRCPQRKTVNGVMGSRRPRPWVSREEIRLTPPERCEGTPAAPDSASAPHAPVRWRSSGPASQRRRCALRPGARRRCSR